MPPVRCAPGVRHGAGQRGRTARATRGGDRAVVPRDPREEPAGAPHAQGGAQRRLRRAGRAPGAGRQRDAPLLHDRGGQGGPARLPREAQAGVREVPETAVTPALETLQKQLKKLPQA